MASLYSIAGLLDDLNNDGVPFGGYFFEKEWEEGFFPPDDLTSRANIEGELTDRYGRSLIRGEKAHSNLSFQKFYQDRNPIEYNFTFDQERKLWVGEYEGSDCGRGPATCNIHLAIGGLKLKIQDPVNPEVRARKIVDELLRDGSIIEAPE